MNDTHAAPGAAFADAHVEADGFRIRYQEGGSGAPLVCLHGGGGLRLSRAHDLLAKNRRVIAFEIPGFGDFPLKTATMVNSTDFAGSAGYGSVGCGRVKVSTEGSFEGRNMSLVAGLTSDCFHARFRGDLSR